MQARDLLDELTTVLKGKTFDALLPPLAYVLVQQFFGLTTGIVVAVLISFLLILLRILKHQKSSYAFLGLAGVVIAGSYAWLTKDPKAYFLGSLISSGLIFILALISVLLSKPLAALLSHLSRGWPLNWYWRKDILPAYKEVSIAWTLLLGLRFAIQWVLFMRSNPVTLALSNLILGWPMTIGVLLLTYIFGIWRLKTLKGPGVEEFIAGKKAPFKGQTKGF